MLGFWSWVPAWYAGIPFGAAGGCLWFLRDRLRDWFVLQARWQQAKQSTAQEPDLGSELSERLDWWSLIKAGFEPCPSRDTLFYAPWQLAGRPWKLLRRGGWVIPVFRQQGTGRVSEQQIVRITAYRALVEACEGAECPFGVILDGEGYQTTVIKDTQLTRELLASALGLARLLQRGLRERAGLGAPAPQQDAPCRDCPHGRPRLLRPAAVADAPVFRAVGADHRAYHSPCGDRFYWIPPHEQATAKQLRPS